MNFTRRRSIAVLGSVSALSLSGTARASNVIKLSYQRSSTLLTLLKEKGTLERLFGDHGFAVSWHLFDNVIDAMNTGAVDFHSDVADAVPVFTQAQGAPLTFYAEEEGSPRAEAIIVPSESRIQTVEDLKGRKVAVHRGSGCHFILAAALKRVGLSFADIEPAYLKPADAGAAFDKGDVDAWVIWDPFLAITESKRRVRTIVDASGLSAYRRYYLVGNTFAETHPELVELMFASLVDTGRWVKSHPDEAAKILGPLWGGIPTSVIKTVNDRRSYDVRAVEKAQLVEQQKIADVFFEGGLIPKRVDTTQARIWRPTVSRT